MSGISSMNGLTIGEVAKQAEVNVETLRYYERRGILPIPPRSGTNYRRYPATAVRQIRFIKRAQGLGFSLNEITAMLFLRNNPKTSRAAVKARAEAKLVDIEEKIERLTEMRDALAQVTMLCDGKGSIDGCPILQALEGE